MLIVDDSAVVRQVLTEQLSAISGVKVVDISLPLEQLPEIITQAPSRARFMKGWVNTR